MTVVAGIAAAYVILVLAAGHDAVMAGAAGAYDLRVVDDDCRRPDGIAVAVFADV